MNNKTELMQEFEVEYIDYFSNAKAENIFHSLSKDSLGFYIHPEIVFAFFIFGVKDRQLSKEVEQLRSEIESLKKVQQWISVDDRLPDLPHRKVIVWCEMFYAPHYLHVGTCKDGKWDFGDSRLGQIKYWMPLPAAPEYQSEVK
jgi:hypothetical protein